MEMKFGMMMSKKTLNFEINRPAVRRIFPSYVCNAACSRRIAEITTR